MSKKDDKIIYKFKPVDQNKLEKDQTENNNKTSSKSAKIIAFVSTIVIAVVAFLIKYSISLPKSYSYKCEKTEYYDYGSSTNEVNIHFNKDGYQYIIEKKEIILFSKIELTDEIYKIGIANLKLLPCYDSSTESYTKCTDSHLDLGYTSLGEDTVIDRYNDTIIIKSKYSYGYGSESTKSDINSLIKSIEEDHGMKCKKN